MSNFIKVQEIYKEIINYYGWNKDEVTNDIDDASKYRLLRNKYAFLMKKVMLRDRCEFKKQRNSMIPEKDAPVIKELLIRAVSNKKEAEENAIIVDWFNGRLDTKDSYTSILLYNSIKPIIMDLSYHGIIDEVTMNEWLLAIGASINYNTAENTAKVKEAIECFRNHALALNQNIDVGSIIIGEEDESRFYHSKGSKQMFDVENEPMSLILKKASSQDDYLNILGQVLQLLEGDAMVKAIERIKICAKWKSVFNNDKADFAVQTESLASEYTIWFQRVYEFLAANPDVLEEVERDTGAEDILNYFKMQDR